MRPIRLPQMAPNKNLALGASIANGLNNALRGYMQTRMQQSQMAAHAATAQAMASYRASQARALDAKSADSSFSKVNLLASASRLKDANGDPIYDPGAVKSLMKEHMAEALEKAPPDQIQAMTQKFEQQAAKGHLPDEFNQYVNQVSPNEAALLSKMQGNQSKEAIQNQKAQTWKEITGMKVEGAQNVADTRAAGAANVANITGRYRSKDAAMRDITSQLNQTSKALSPNNPFGAALDPDAKALMQKRFDDLHDTYNHINSLSPESFGQGQKPGASLSPPSSPKTFNWDQRSQANVGDVVQTAKGPMQVGSKDSSGLSFKALPAQPASPSVAPAAPEVSAPPPVVGE